MHAEDLVIDECSHRKAVEALCENFPKFDVVPSFAFIVETVDSVDCCTFVIASQQKEVLGVLDLVSEK